MYNLLASCALLVVLLWILSGWFVSYAQVNNSNSRSVFTNTNLNTNYTQFLHKLMCINLTNFNLLEASFTSFEHVSTTSKLLRRLT